jgi:hypothetical protein
VLLRRPSSALRARAAAAWARVGPAELGVGISCALIAAVGTIGADSRWLAALGGAIAERGSIPKGVPFASAPSADWPNVPVLAELVLHGLTAGLGDRGLLLAQLVAVAGGLAILAADARRDGATETGIGITLLLALTGGVGAFLVVRSQLFSILLFPALAAVLRAETRAPSRRVWLIPPLLALWSNLHGAVLVGLAIATIYLVFARARRRFLEASCVLAASALAVCATPALLRTPAYYYGVLRNEAARSGEGLWAPLSLTSIVDLLLLGTGIALVALALRARPALWEIVSVCALALVAVRTARSGVWLLVFAAPPAARAIRLTARSNAWAVAAAAAAVVVIYGFARGPVSTDASGRLVRETIRVAGGTPVLADGTLAEQVALAGGRVWMSNPLDAFPRSDQRLYLDWLQGREQGSAAFAHAPRAVFVRRYGLANRLAAVADGLREVSSDAYAILYVKER